MTDAQTAGNHSPTLRQPPILKVGRPKNTARRAPMGLSRKVKAAIDIAHDEGLSRKEAAARVGLADHTLYLALRNPLVMKYWNECRDVLRTSEGPRSIHKIAHLRDKAESERVQLDAARFLVDGDKGSGVNVQVNLNANITPGYMVDVSEHAPAAGQILNLARSTRNLLDQSQSVLSDEDRTT